MIKKEDIRKALKTIRCCRDDFCVKCPMQKEICDEARVEMESLPAELVDKIEEILEAALADFFGKRIVFADKGQKE